MSSSRQLPHSARPTARCRPARSSDKTKFSPQVGVSYEISEAFSVYASYGKGFRFNTGTGAPNAAGVATLFEPETTKSVEVGAKFALFDEMLNGTIAAFETKKNNVLTADPANPGFSQGLGKARSRGIEFDATGELPAGFRLTVAYAYLDAEVRTAAIDPNFGFELRVGDPLINIPKNSGSVLLFKDFEFGEQKLTLGAGVNYVGKRLGETGYRFPNAAGVAGQGPFFNLPVLHADPGQRGVRHQRAFPHLGRGDQPVRREIFPEQLFAPVDHARHAAHLDGARRLQALIAVPGDRPPPA